MADLSRTNFKKQTSPHARDEGMPIQYIGQRTYLPHICPVRRYYYYQVLLYYPSVKLSREAACGAGIGIGKGAAYNTAPLPIKTFLGGTMTNVQNPRSNCII